MSKYICEEIELEKVFSAIATGEKVIIYRDTTKAVVEVAKATVKELMEILTDRENCFYYAFIVKEVTNNVSAAEPV